MSLALSNVDYHCKCNLICVFLHKCLYILYSFLTECFYFFRTNKKKAPAPSFDVFNLQEGELPTVRDRKSSATSVLYNRVANGQTRRTAHLDGSFYIELKVFNSADVDAGGDDLWKKSLLWLKLRTNDDTPHWDRVQKFVRQASSLFESEATFYSNNINFK